MTMLAAILRVAQAPSAVSIPNAATESATSAAHSARSAGEVGASSSPVTAAMASVAPMLTAGERDGEHGESPRCARRGAQGGSAGRSAVFGEAAFELGCQEDGDEDREQARKGAAAQKGASDKGFR